MNEALSQYQGRPLRVMQVIPFYPPYLQQLYDLNPCLEQLDFSAQSQALVKGCFSAIHVFTPYLQGCETLLAVSNCASSQLAWLRESGESIDSEDDLPNEILRRQVAHFKPDILYSDAEEGFTKFIQTLPHPRPAIMAWRAADVYMQSPWHHYDAIVSGLPKLLAFARSKGVKNTFMFHPGMPLWVADQVSLLPHEVDVVFVGSISVTTTQHVQRIALLDMLAQAATKHNFSLELYLNCNERLILPSMRPYVRPAVFGLGMHKVLRRGKIVIDDRAWHGVILPNDKKVMDLGGDDTSNMRIFEGIGGGSMVLTEHLEGVARYFEIDKEIATYKSHAEAVEKILYYIEHEEERARIAKAGQERCLKDWNIEVAAQKFLEIAQKLLTKKADSV